DSTRLRRVFDNLLSNAIKYSPDGGDIRISLHRQLDSGGSWAVVEVCDQRLGIPVADQSHIFVRFHRAPNVVGHIVGTGLGLAGSFGIVQQHGGTITVSSAEQRGSTFTVRLPLPTSTHRLVRVA